MVAAPLGGLVAFPLSCLPCCLTFYLLPWRRGGGWYSRCPGPGFKLPLSRTSNFGKYSPHPTIMAQTYHERWRSLKAVMLRRRRSGRALILEGKLLDRRFRHHWKSYLLQCGLATFALLLILLALDVVLQAAIVVAIASSAFIVFAVPHSNASSPRRIVGGHLVAVLVSAVVSLVHLTPVGANLGADLSLGYYLVVDMMAVVSVGLSIFVMVVTNTEHPPAAGTALGLVVVGWSLPAVIFVMLGAIALSAAHMLLRNRLTNLI